MASVHEQLTDQFRRWEMRGRGWQVFEQPVSPEPPFVPFPGYHQPSAPHIDDGRKATFLSSFVQKLSNKLSTAPPSASVEPEVEPTPLERTDLVEFQASLPDKLDVSTEAFEQFFLSLSRCREPIAFELLGTHKKITTQFAAAPSDAPLVHRQLSAYFPEALFIPVENNLISAWNATTGDEMLAVEFGLEREFMLPLASGKLDPFIGLVGALCELQPGELGLFQVLWQPVQHPWAENIVHSVTHSDGKPFFVNEPELAGAAENKVTKPLYAALVRILVCANVFDRVLQLAQDLAGSLRVFAHPQGNALIPLHNEAYDFAEHIEDVLRRQTRRSGMILNSDELTGFVHLPSSAVRSPAFQRNSGKTKAAPEIVTQPPGIVIGDNEHNGQTVPVFLTADQRVRHTHIIGNSGCGKSSLLLNLIRQDLDNGDGVAVLDPHGDLIDQILTLIPPERIDDVVLVNPSDVEFPIGFNILQAHSEAEKNLLASDLVSVFRRLATSWGDQMDTVLQNAILVFLESKQGGTLADLRRFLLEPAFRTDFLRTVTDPELIYYWQKVFPHLGGGKSIGSILTRLQDFFSRKPLRNMVSQRENKLDFAEIMDSGKIFLAKLSEGLCGAENSYLLGTLMVSKFQQLAMARQAQQMAVRKDFWLYVDEFDHFISPSMAEILKGARKYRLGLTLAHQELHQLRSDSKVESAVLTQPCTRMVFRVGDEDAKKLGEGFTAFDAQSLKTLEKFHALVRVERNDFDFNLALRKPQLETISDPQAIIAASRARYATPRAEVETMLLASLRDEVKAAVPPPIIESKLETVAETSPVAEIPKPTVSEKERVKAAEPKDLGRGGVRHKAIQSRLKSEAQKLGFHAEVEKQLANGSNAAADLIIRRGPVEIAMEITLTTSVDHEFDNVKKCLAAGLHRVAVVATGRKRLEDIAAAVAGGLGPQAAAKVTYHTPDEFLAELQKLAKTVAVPPPSEPMAKTGQLLGFEITRNFPQLSPEELRLNQQAIHEVALKAIRP